MSETPTYHSAEESRLAMVSRRELIAEIRHLSKERDEHEAQLADLQAENRRLREAVEADSGTRFGGG